MCSRGAARPWSRSPTVTAPEPTFTGDVQIGGYFRRESPSRLAGATVTFPPGARTPWKVNPLGQTIIVTNGIGYAQAEGQEIVEIHPGDLLWFSPGQKHWEGAFPIQPMTYIALQEEESQIVQFLAAVTDNEYQPNAEGA
jgi:quercetin dioxygenase-like cupin family protein